MFENCPIVNSNDGTGRVLNMTIIYFKLLQLLKRKKEEDKIIIEILTRFIL